MDELPNGLAALIADARVAHDPSDAELRRLGAGLGAIIPGLAPVALLAEGMAHGATDAAVQGAVQVTSIKAAWLGSAGAAKIVGVLMTVSVAGAAITVRQTSREVERPARAVTTAKPAAGPASPATEPPRAPVPDAAPAVAPMVSPAQQPGEETPARTRSRAQPAAARAPKPAAPVAASNSEELGLIEGALGALRHHDPVLAERLLREHETRFPNGQLARERTGLTLIALCEQGRTAEAEPQKARFIEENAGSPIAARVARTCR